MFFAIASRPYFWYNSGVNGKQGPCVRPKDRWRMKCPKGRNGWCDMMNDEVTLKAIKDRMEFGEAVNLGKYPVVIIDVTKSSDRTALYSVPVRVDMGKFSNGTPYIAQCHFNVFDDEYNGDGKCHCTVMNYGCGISAGFDYYDALKCAENANTPILKADSWAVIVVHNSDKKMLRAFKVKFANVNRNCTTAIRFADDIDSYVLAKAILKMA